MPRRRTPCPRGRGARGRRAWRGPLLARALALLALLAATALRQRASCRARPAAPRPPRADPRRRGWRAPPRCGRRPAATTSCTFEVSMPPMANQGVPAARAAAWRTYSRPAAGRPCLVGVSHTGPTLSWSAPERSAASSCSGEWVESPISSSSPTASRTAATGLSSCPTCTPSAPAASARSGRSFSHSSAPCSSQSVRRRAARGKQLLVGGALVAQLHHVHTAGERLAHHLLDALEEVGHEVEARLTQVHALIVPDRLRTIHTTLVEWAHARGDRRRRAGRAGRAARADRRGLRRASRSSAARGSAASGRSRTGPPPRTARCT